MPQKKTRTTKNKSFQLHSVSRKVLLTQASKWGAIIGMVFVIFLFTILLYMAQRAVQEPQDVRRDAMVENGQVQLSTELSPAKLQIDQPASLKYSVNTNNQPINGVEVIFDIITDTFGPEDLEVVGMNADLVYAHQEVDSVDHGMKVHVIALTNNFDRGFRTSGAAPYLELRFTPRSTGDISVNFDVERSVAPVFRSNPVVDQLRTIPIAHYTVFATETDENTETISIDDLRFSESQLQTDLRIFTNDSARSPLAFSQLRDGETYAFSAVARITNRIYDPAATSEQQLSVRMRANDQTLTNSLPYQSLLRTSNPIAVTFESTFVAREENTFSFTLDPDSRIAESNRNNNSIEYTYELAGTGGGTTSDSARSCNERCSSNRDCGVSQRCFDTGTDGKRCRLATNVTNTQCQAGAQTQSQQAAAPTTTTPAVQSCNQSCSSNNDCDVNFRCYQGACRLATNPSSLSCSSASAGIVSQTYQKGAQTPASEPEPTPTPTATPEPDFVPFPITPDAGSELPAEEPAASAWDELLSYMQNIFGSGNLPSFLTLPILLTAVAIIILLGIIVLIAKASASNRARQTSSISKTEPTPAQPANTPSHTSAPLQQPKENPAPPHLPGHGITPPNKSSSSSMLDRLKEKGIKKPGE